MIRLLLIAVLTALPVSSVSAQELPVIDPWADQVLRDMGRFLAETPSFRLRAEATVDDWIDSGQLAGFGHSLDMVVRRPDRIWVDVRGDVGHRRLLVDGSTVRLVDYEYGTVAETRASGTIENTLNELMDRLWVVLPLAEVAFDDPYTTLIEDVETGTYVGLREVDGVQYHHVAFTQATIDWEAWIESGPRPLLKKLTIRYKDEPGVPQFTAMVTEWEIPAPAPDALFGAESPDGFQSIEFVEVAGGDR